MVFVRVDRIMKVLRSVLNYNIK